MNKRDEAPSVEAMTRLTHPGQNSGMYFGRVGDSLRDQCRRATPIADSSLSGEPKVPPLAERISYLSGFAGPDPPPGRGRPAFMEIPQRIQCGISTIMNFRWCGTGDSARECRLCAVCRRLLWPTRRLQNGGYRAPRDGPVVIVRNGANSPGHPSRGGAISTGDIMTSAAASS